MSTVIPGHSTVMLFRDLCMHVHAAVFLQAQILGSPTMWSAASYPWQEITSFSQAMADVDFGFFEVSTTPKALGSV